MRPVSNVITNIANVNTHYFNILKLNLLKTSKCKTYFDQHYTSFLVFFNYY